MFDSHCHLHDPDVLDPDLLWQRARAAGVQACLLAGVSEEGWQPQIAFAERHPECVVSFGIHPQLVAERDATELRAMLPALAQQLDAPRSVTVVALGEIGLDRATPAYCAALPLQEELFRCQLAMARERDLPVILHVVDAHGRALEILRQDGVPKRGGVMHSFSGSGELVRDYEMLGLYVSFSGAVCNPRATRLQRAVPRVSASRLLVETDAPYQTPYAQRPAKNEPAYLGEVVKQVAELRGQSFEEIALLTERNARTLFGL